MEIDFGPTVNVLFARYEDLDETRGRVSCLDEVQAFKIDGEEATGCFARTEGRDGTDVELGKIITGEAIQLDCASCRNCCVEIVYVSIVDNQSAVGGVSREKSCDGVVCRVVVVLLYSSMNFDLFRGSLGSLDEE